jgi:DNA adenine methylase Dam
LVKPLFKWTGGKGRLFQRYHELGFFPHPDEFDVFVDLFFGAGAVSCWVHNLYPDKPLIINDLNSELINMLMQIRNNWAEFKDNYQRIVEVFLNTPVDRRKALYNCYKKRYAWNYDHLSEAEIAANLLVMLKTNFNGIWQSYIMYGRRYSTPPGHINYKASIFDIEKVEQFREMLQRATIYNTSYINVPIPENAWVFADPPYRDTRKMYSDQFVDEDQVRLAQFLQEHDCLYAESNKEIGDGFWEEHFPDTPINYLDHKYTCGHGAAVNPVTEVLIKNYGTPNNGVEDFFDV